MSRLQLLAFLLLSGVQVLVNAMELDSPVKAEDRLAHDSEKSARDELPLLPTIEITPSVALLGSVKHKLLDWADVPEIDHRYIADKWFKRDSVPGDVKEKFPFLEHRNEANLIRVDSFLEGLGSLGKMLTRLSGLEHLTFPVGLQSESPDGHITYTIGIEGIEFDGLVAKLKNIFLKIHFAGYDPLIFGAPEVAFTRTGGFVEAKLGLLANIPIPLNGDPNTLLILSGYNHNNKRGCVATINCDGFESIQLDASLMISRDLIYPVDPFGKDNGGYIRAHIGGNFSSLSDMSGTIGASEPFKIRGVDRAIFTFETAVFDGSEISTDTRIAFPTGYFADPDEILSRDQWQGIYVERIAVKLDQFAEVKNIDEFGLAVDGLIIDRFGVTGTFSGEKLLPLDKGKIGRARISVDLVALDIYKSQLETGYAEGRIALPAVDDGSDQAGLIYTATVEKSGWEFSAGITPGDAMPFPLLKGRVLLETGTHLIIGKSQQSEKTYVQLTLCGRADLDNIWPSQDKKDSSWMSFQGFTVQNDLPLIKNIGAWDVPLQRDVPIGPMKLTIDQVLAGETATKEVRLFFSGGASFSGTSGFSIGAKAGVSIYGKHDPMNNDRLVFDRVEVEKIGLCVATESWGANVELHWFEEDAVYGKGFMGKAAVGLAAMGYNQEDGCDFDAGIFAWALFGHRDTTRYYNFELLYVNLEQGIPLGPLAIHGLGGAISNRMSVKGIDEITFQQINYEDTSRINQTQNQANNLVADETIGQSLMGIQYVPDPGKGFELRLMALAALEGKSSVANMNAKLTFSFNTSNGLDSINFDMQGQMLRDMKLTSIKKDSVPVYFDANIKYNVVDQIFHLAARVSIDVKKTVIGGGHLVIHAEPNRWYIHVGQPGEPGNVGLIIPIIGLESNAYFCAGNYNVPDMPLLPVPLRNTFSGASKERTFEVDSELAGLAFGAHLDIGSPEEKKFAFFYYNFHILLGFDINLRHYKDYVCHGDASFGLRQWYAKGQAYAYLHGAIGLVAAKKKIPILELTAGFKIYLEAPNPTYGEFGLVVKYRVLGGLLKGRAKIEASFGEKCDFEKDKLEIHVFDDVIAPVNGAPLNVTQDITFSSGVPFYQSFPDEMGQSEFQIQLLDHVSLQDNRDDDDREDRDGDRTETTVGSPRNQHTSTTQIKQSPTQGVAYFERDGQRHYIPCERIYTEDNTFVTYRPQATWPPNTTVYIHPEAHFKQSNNQQNWRPVKDGHGRTSQDTIYQFITGDYPDHIPSYNVDWTYPVNGMSNFYPRQLEHEGHRGMIHLKKDMAPLFDQIQIKAVHTCHSHPNFSFNADCHYDPATQILFWYLDPGKIKREGIYSIYFKTGDREIAPPIHFRCSRFDRLTDKIEAIHDQTETLAQPQLQALQIPIPVEPFDQMELYGDEDMAPLLRFDADFSSYHDQGTLIDQETYYNPKPGRDSINPPAQIYLRNRFRHYTAFQDIPATKVVPPDQIGEIPTYQKNTDLLQSLYSELHIKYVYTKESMLMDYRILDPEEVMRWKYSFIHPDSFQPEWIYHIGEGYEQRISSDFNIETP